MFFSRLCTQTWLVLTDASITMPVAASELEEVENISAEIRFISTASKNRWGKKRISFLFPLPAFKSIFGVCADMRKASGGCKLELFGDDIEEVLTALHSRIDCTRSEHAD